jgi:hypothetical protein
MKTLFYSLPVLLSLILAGCANAPHAGARDGGIGSILTPPPPSSGHVDEDAIKQNLAGLNPQDRELAMAQRFCPVMTDNRLGEMGPPIKVILKGQPVFLCCLGCVKKAQNDPDATLAKVAQLKTQAASQGR